MCIVFLKCVQLKPCEIPVLNTHERKLNFSQFATIISKEQYVQIHHFHMGQSIQEWAKWNLWNTAFKKFKGCIPQNLL